jgi:hypothetical protein
MNGREQAEEHATPDQVTAAEALRHRAVGGAREAGPGLEDHDRRREHELVERRSELLPEEEAAGSDDREAQAARILEDSAMRTEVPGAAPTTHLEHRRVDETSGAADPAGGPGSGGAAPAG